jgi:hypothetical protein
MVARFLARDDKSPIQYRALRRLEARNQKFGASAWMDVWTDVDAAGGLRYEVAAEGGSGYIRKRVFRAALDGEQKMLRDGDPQRAQLDLTNYLIEDGGISDGIASLTIKPRRKDVLLIDGRIFVKPEDGDLLRIEGRLSKNPSFWTRKVEIVRRYGRLAGVHVPLEIESDAQIFIAGQSTFRMTYEYETINGERVGRPTPREPEKVESTKYKVESTK